MSGIGLTGLDFLGGIFSEQIKHKKLEKMTIICAHRKVEPAASIEGLVLLGYCHVVSDALYTITEGIPVSVEGIPSVK